MGASIRPDDDPAALWDRLVQQGMSPDSATKVVASKHGAPPMAPRDGTANPAPKAVPSQYLRAAEQGATFGFGDEINAGVRSLTGTPYSTALKDERDKMAAFKQDSPIGSAVAEIGGAVGGGLLGGAALGAGRAALGLAPKAIQIAGTMGRGARAMQVAAQIGKGAVAGGAMAAGTAEGDLGDRARAVPMGAAFGAGTVAGFKGVGALANATGATGLVRNLLPRAEDATSRMGRVSQALGVATHAENARADILKQLQRAGLDVSELEARAGAAHSEQMLLDEQIGGKSMLRRARGVQSIPSKGSEQVETALTTRNEGAPLRVQQVLEQESGHTKDNAVLRAKALQGERSATAAVNYPKAYDAPPIEDPEVLSLFKDPVFKQAHESARRMAAREGVELPPLTRTVDIGGEQVTELVPQPIQAFDWMKHGLDDLIEVGSNGQRTMGRNEARITRNKLAKALERIDAMPEHAPYAEARRTFREGSQKMEAQELGAKLFNTKNDELAATVPGLSDEARDEFRRAALGATEDRLSGVADGRNAARELTKNDLLKQKLRHLFPDDAAADRAFSGLETESAMHKNGSFVLGGSPTARILAEQGDDVGGAGLNQIMQAAGGSPAGLLTRLMQNGAAARMRGLSEVQSTQLAPLLTAKGDRLREVVEMLKAKAAADAARKASGGRLTRAIGQTAGASAGTP